MTVVEAIMQLNKIFKNKQWSDKDIDEFVFNSFCNLFNNINEQQRALIIELTNNYTWITFNDYQSKILSVLESVESDKLKELKKIYFFPIYRVEDEGKVKSGQFILYQIKNFKRYLKNYSNIKFEILTTFDHLKEGEFKLNDGEALFLMDDYIGSGETLRSCLEQVRKNPKITNDVINVVSIACQEEIFSAIQNEGVCFYSEIILKRGISDYNEDPILNEKIMTMLEIEKMIPGSNHFSLGYNASEALITLMRTPDNTFPIFWKTYRKVNEKFEAPFSREEPIEA